MKKANRATPAKAPEIFRSTEKFVAASLGDVKLTPLERRVLQFIKDGGGKVKERSIKLAFWDEIKSGFSFDSLDKRCFSNTGDGIHLSLCALWLLDSKDPLLGLIDRIIKQLTKLIRENPDRDLFNAEEIASSLGIPKTGVPQALAHMRELGFYFGGTHSADGFGFETVALSDTGSDLEAYIQYGDIQDQLEQYWQGRSSGRANPRPCGFDLGDLLRETSYPPGAAQPEATYRYLSKSGDLLGLDGKAVSFNRGMTKALLEQFLLNRSLDRKRIEEVLKWYRSERVEDLGRAIKDLNRRLRACDKNLAVETVGGTFTLNAHISIVN